MRLARIVGTTIAAVFVLAVACGPPATPSVSPAAPAPRETCAHVADHLLSLMSTTAKEAPTEEVDRVRVAFEQRCSEDRWSAEARHCFLGLADKVEVDRCATLLTEQQRSALEQPPSTTR
jgi:hypothetical protein